MSIDLSTFSFPQYLNWGAREGAVWTAMLEEELQVVIADVLKCLQGIWENAPISAQ